MLPALQRTFNTQALHLGFAIALLWLLHPLNSEVVSYLSQRTESLMACFYLLAIYFSIRAHDSGLAGHRAAAVVSCAAGMTCKESMVTAPVAIVLYDLAFRAWSVRDALRRRGRFYAALMATWMLLLALIWSGPRAQTAGFSTSVSWSTYLMNQAVMLVRYLWLTIWPRDLVLNYGRPIALTFGDVAPEVLVVAIIGLLTIVAWLRWRPLGFPGLWFFLTLSPTTLVPIATEVGAERRMYLPLIGLIGLGVSVFARLLENFRTTADRSRAARVAATASAAIVLVVSTAFAAVVVRRNRDYQSALAMAKTVVDRWPTGVANAMAGVAAGEAGLREEAIAHFQNAVADGHRLALYPLAVELSNSGRGDEAAAHLQTLLDADDVDPDGVDRGLVLAARTLLARLRLEQGRWAEAVTQADVVLGAGIADRAVQRLLADALLAGGNISRAVSEYQKHLARTPQDTDAWSNLVLALLRTGDVFSAEKQARQALVISPEDARLLDLLGRTLLAQNRMADAEQMFERAVRADPRYAPAQESLTRLRKRTPGVS